jgi:hypothetical protein
MVFCWSIDDGEEMIPVNFKPCLRKWASHFIIFTSAGGDVPFHFAWTEACTSSLDCMF